MRVRLITVSSALAGGKEVPSLRISGQWLAKIGFSAGKKAIIQERPGQLTIQLITIEEVSHTNEIKEAAGEYRVSCLFDILKEGAACE